MKNIKMLNQINLLRPKTLGGRTIGTYHGVGGTYTGGEKHRPYYLIELERGILTQFLPEELDESYDPKDFYKCTMEVPISGGDGILGGGENFCIVCGISSNTRDIRKDHSGSVACEEHYNIGLDEMGEAVKFYEKVKM